MTSDLFKNTQSSQFDDSETNGKPSAENAASSEATFDDASTQTSAPLNRSDADGGETSSISVVLPLVSIGCGERAENSERSERDKKDETADRDASESQTVSAFGDENLTGWPNSPNWEANRVFVDKERAAVDSTQDWNAATRLENEQTVVSKEPPDEFGFRSARFDDETDDAPDDLGGGKSERGESRNGGALPPGTRFGHFVVTKYIGGGGMGRVYEGIDAALDRKVAIKVLPRQRAQDQATVARFLNEAKSAARLNNEHIAQVYFCGEENGVPFIAFEYVSGTNLRDYVRERGVLELGEAIDYVLQAADALAHASAHGVTHRDVKPSNIIVTPRKSAKLIDMGLARLLKSDFADDLTESGVTLGTFDYISPEQARDPRVADVRSDIYSLGCTFYYMLVGTPPFPEGTVLQKLLQHQGVEAADVREANPDVPVEVAAIVKKMMKKNPDERYQTPDALIADLLEIAEMIGLRLSDRGTLDAERSTEATTASGLRRLPAVCAVAIFLAANGIFYWATRGDDVRTPTVEVPLATNLTNATNISNNLAGASGETAPTAPTNVSTAPIETAQTESVAAVSGGEFLNAAALDAFYSLRDGATLRRPALLVDDGRQWRRDFLSGSASAAESTSAGESRRVAAGWRARSPIGGTNGANSLGASDDGAAVARVFSAYSLLGVASDGTSTSGTGAVASGVVVRTVDRSGTEPQTFATLEAALASGGRETSAPLRVELKFNGTLETPPISIVGAKVEIVAAEGFRPTLLFKAPDAANGGWGERMFLVNGGELTLDGVSVDFTVPSQEVVAPKWSVFELLAASSLTVRGATLTVCNAIGETFGAPLHSNVALFRSAAQTALEGTTSVANSGAAANAGPNVRLENAFVRCESSVFVAERTFGAFFAANSGFNASGPILRFAEGVGASNDDGARFALNFERTVVVGRSALARLDGSDLESSAIPLDVSLTDSFVRLASAPLGVAFATNPPNDGAKIGGVWTLNDVLLLDLSAYWQTRLRRSTQSWEVPIPTESGFEARNLSEFNADASTRLNETPPHLFDVADFSRLILTPIAASAGIGDDWRTSAENLKAVFNDEKTL